MARKAQAKETASRQNSDRPASDSSRDVVGKRDMGDKLRSVYQTTVDELIPDDLLDLLGKLD